MDSVPSDILKALLTVSDFVNGAQGSIHMDTSKETISYSRDSVGTTSMTAQCAMDSARAAVKDYCKQVICEIPL